MKSQTLYDKDFNLWIETTLKQIKERNFESVDWENVLEELESLGKQQKRELENRLIILLEHLLKLTYWEVEKGDNERGWRGTIVEQRKQILKLIKNNPSLQPFLNEVYENCYTDARELAIVKTGLDQELFPIQPILTLEELLNESFSIH